MARVSFIFARCAGGAILPMKDPTTLGVVTSASTLLVLSVWKSRILRWLALFAAGAALVWALGGETSAVAPRSMPARSTGDHLN